ncbi:MAG: carboxymuconolactone decarboxylase family protein [Christensenellales bacterium]|jgi:AhpD family alkylhydroperoxidase
MSNRKEQLDSFFSGLKAMGNESPDSTNAFMNLLKTTYSPGALSVKMKELISVAIGCYARCEYCIVYHVNEALKSGATREEIIDAAMVSVAFGGGPSMAYAVIALKETLDEFA